MTAVPTYCPFERIPRRLYGGSPRSQIMSSEFETCFLDLKMQATKIIAKKTRKPVNTLDVSPKISSKFNAFYFPHLFFVAVATLTFWENFWPTKIQVFLPSSFSGHVFRLKFSRMASTSSNWPNVHWPYCRWKRLLKVFPSPEFKQRHWESNRKVGR